MLSMNANGIFHPPRYVAFKNRSHSRDHFRPHTPHNTHKQKLGTPEVTTVTHAKRKGSSSTSDKSSIYTLPQPSQELDRPVAAH